MVKRIATRASDSTWNRQRCVLCVLALSIGVARSAQADETAPLPVPAPAPPASPSAATPIEMTNDAVTPDSETAAKSGETRWYGWQNMLVDGGTIALSVALLTSDNREVVERAPLVFLAGYALGSPSVHWAHENVGKGFASLGIRVGAPLVGGLAGCALDDSNGDFGCLGGVVIGAAAMSIAGIVVDYAVLAYDDAPPKRMENEAKGPRVTPTLGVVPEKRGVTPAAGLAGTF